MKSPKEKNMTVVILSVGAIIIISILFLWRSPNTSRSDPAPARPRYEPAISPSAPEPMEEPVDPTKTPPRPEEKTPLEKKEVVSDVTEKNGEPMNPEDQPRTFFLLDFKELNDLPEGYTMEDLVLTEEGLELKPLEPGEEARPRFGVLNSSPEEMDFPSNAVSALWKEDVGDGTSVLIEVSVSPDSENWGIWHQIYYDDDAGEPAEFYPDGSPNPNYGYRPGGVLCWGMKQYKYFRYRATLYSEADGSPVFSGFRLFYQDSTLGDGHLAEVKDIPKEE